MGGTQEMRRRLAQVICDPNGILSVGNQVLKVLTLLPEPPLLRLTA
jgi:hypothetical protein